MFHNFLFSFGNCRQAIVLFTLIVLFLPANRDNGVKAIENLMKKKGKFDYILLETTGLADPGNDDKGCRLG
jgi:CobW/HypB/UreG, nucleotide-binding domain